MRIGGNFSTSMVIWNPPALIFNHTEKTSCQQAWRTNAILRYTFFTPSAVIMSKRVTILPFFRFNGIVKS
jgi:hypothetical protein